MNGTSETSLMLDSAAGEHNHGQAESSLSLQEQKCIDILRKGAHFGEIALFSNLRRTCSVQANTHCTLTTLAKPAIAKM